MTIYQCRCKPPSTNLNSFPHYSLLFLLINVILHIKLLITMLGAVTEPTPSSSAKICYLLRSCNTYLLVSCSKATSWAWMMMCTPTNLLHLYSSPHACSSEVRWARKATNFCTFTTFTLSVNICNKHGKLKRSSLLSMKSHCTTQNFAPSFMFWLTTRNSGLGSTSRPNFSAATHWMFKSRLACAWQRCILSEVRQVWFHPRNMLWDSNHMNYYLHGHDDYNAISIGQNPRLRLDEVSIEGTRW